MQRFTETTNHSIAWIKRISEEGTLEMKPPFQRNPVWSDKQKGALIETILLEYPIPEIYMQNIVDENGNEKHIVVDGQQRIRSILEFISGDVGITEDGSQWQGMSFDDLSPSDKKKIYEYKLVTRILPSIPDEVIRAIFQRINRNTVVLNQQELRHATYWGPFIKLVEEIADYDYWSDIGIFSPNDRRRMIDAEYVSEIAVAYLNGPQNKKIKLEYYYQIYEQEFEQSGELRYLFRRVLGELKQTLPDLKETRWSKKSDFYTLFLVMSIFRDMFPLSLEKREDLKNALTVFADQVSIFIRTGEGDYGVSVVNYAHNVERAASDLGSRRQRQASLFGVIKDALKLPDGGLAFNLDNKHF